MRLARLRMGMVLVLSSLLLSPAQSLDRRAKALAPGEEAPLRDHKMSSVAGEQVSISSQSGKNGILLVFTCIGCPFVKAWDSRLSALGQEALKSGFGVLFVNSNDPGVSPADNLEAMKAKAKAQGYGFPFAVDSGSRLAAAFGAGRTPEVFLMDPKGRVAYHGAVDDNAYEPEKVTAHHLREALKALAAGKPVPQPETKSMGCGIKYPSESH